MPEFLCESAPSPTTPSSSNALLPDAHHIPDEVPFAQHQLMGRYEKHPSQES